jgi:redox-sensing transcriptional repressor
MFRSSGFVIVQAFDVDSQMIGAEIAGVRVRATSELGAYLKLWKIDIAILAVPELEASRIAEDLVKGGVRAILNYSAPFRVDSEGIQIRNVDPVLLLQSMCYGL